MAPNSQGSWSEEEKDERAREKAQTFVQDPDLQATTAHTKCHAVHVNLWVLGSLELWSLHILVAGHDHKPIVQPMFKTPDALKPKA